MCESSETRMHACISVYNYKVIVKAGKEMPVNVAKDNASNSFLVMQMKRLFTNPLKTKSSLA